MNDWMDDEEKEKNDNDDEMMDNQNAYPISNSSFRLLALRGGETTDEEAGAPAAAATSEETDETEERAECEGEEGAEKMSKRVTAGSYSIRSKAKWSKKEDQTKEREGREGNRQRMKAEIRGEKVRGGGSRGERRGWRWGEQRKCQNA